VGVNVILCLERETKITVYDLRSSILQIKNASFTYKTKCHHNLTRPKFEILEAFEK